MSEEPRFQPDQILLALSAEGVDYVVVGGFAAQVHGSPSLTRDIDICYGLDRENLGRLARALSKLRAIRRGSSAGVNAPIDELALRAGDLFTLTTQHGDVDLLGHPDPGFDFETLDRTAIDAAIAGVRVRVASLDDLIAMKRAAGRPKDRIELEILGALREEIDRTE